MGALTYWPEQGSVAGVIGGIDNQEKLPQTFPNRDVAIAEALAAGRKTYTFTTNFIPGIGMASSEGGINFNQ